MKKLPRIRARSTANQIRLPARNLHLRGMTLIEVMIVLALLTALLILSLLNGPRYISKSHDARRKTDLQTYKVAFEHYYEDNQCYPDPAEVLDCNATDTSLQPYMKKILCDPRTGDPYTFTIEGCSSFKVYATLVNPEDPDIRKVGCQLGCGPTEGEEVYNYGVSSTNVSVGEPVAAQTGGGDNGGDGGGETYTPLDCVQQPDGTWSCSCTPGSSCGLGCPGNTICSSDGTYCYLDLDQCPIGPPPG